VLQYQTRRTIATTTRVVVGRQEKSTEGVSQSLRCSKMSSWAAKEAAEASTRRSQVLQKGSDEPIEIGNHEEQRELAGVAIHEEVDRQQEGTTRSIERTIAGVVPRKDTTESVVREQQGATSIDCRSGVKKNPIAGVPTIEGRDIELKPHTDSHRSTTDSM
jgi:hypothetical protein